MKRRATLVPKLRWGTPIPEAPLRPRANPLSLEWQSRKRSAGHAQLTDLFNLRHLDAPSEIPPPTPVSLRREVFEAERALYPEPVARTRGTRVPRSLPRGTQAKRSFGEMRPK